MIACCMRLIDPQAGLGSALVCHEGRGRTASGDAFGLKGCNLFVDMAAVRHAVGVFARGHRVGDVQETLLRYGIEAAQLC